jgi:hypothetical protein
MVTHFPDDHEARAAVDPVLRAWEPSAFLERHRIAFRFRDAEVLDGNPPKVDIALTHSDYATVKVRAILLAEKSITRSPPGERRTPHFQNCKHRTTYSPCLPPGRKERDP